MGSKDSEPSSPWLNQGLDLVHDEHKVFSPSLATGNKGLVIDKVETVEKRESTPYAVIKYFDGVVRSGDYPDRITNTTYEMWFRIVGDDNTGVLLQRAIKYPTNNSLGVGDLKYDICIKLESGILNVGYFSTEGITVASKEDLLNSKMTWRKYKDIDGQDIDGLTEDEWKFNKDDGWCHVAVTFAQVASGYELSIYVKKGGKEMPAYTTGRVNATLLPATSGLFDTAYFEYDKGVYLEGDLEIGKELSAMIDEVRIWNTTRSHEDVINTRNVFLNGTNSDDIAAYIPFNFMRDKKYVYAEITSYGTRKELIEKIRNGFKDAQTGYAADYKVLEKTYQACKDSFEEIDKDFNYVKAQLNDYNETKLDGRCRD